MPTQSNTANNGLPHEREAMPLSERRMPEQNRNQDLGELSSRPIGVELSPAIYADLLDPALWQVGLAKYARATNLAVALADPAGRLIGSIINLRPTWSFLHSKNLPISSPSAEGVSCPFSPSPLQPCNCVADALARGGVVVARDRAGLVHFAVPLVLGGHPLGALVAGQVFTRYPEQLPLERSAKQLLLYPGKVWELARLEHPVKQATLEVYADLLSTLGQTFLQTRYHSLREAELLAEMTRLRDQAVSENIERKRAEQALRESHTRFEALFNASLVGMYLVDAELRIRLVSRKARPVFGDIGELIGSDFVEVIHILWPPERADELVARFRHTLETGEPYSVAEFSEDRYDRKVREYYDWQIHRIALPDGQHGVVCYFNDISARMLAEQSLRESEHRLRFVMDSMPQKIVTTNPCGDIDYYNPQWYEYTGLSFEQIKGWGWQVFIHPDDLEETVRLWKHAVATGEPYHQEHRFRRADGEYRWHLSRMQAMRDAEGKVVMWVGANTDIHDQRQAANQLRQNAADMSEADRRKDEFLAMLGHELRNPLAPISNALQLVRLSNQDPRREVCEAFDIIERQIENMVRLVDDLLDVARITSGKIQLQKERIDLAAVVARAVEGARPLIDARRHTLEVILPEAPVPVEADPIRLAQVLWNLLNNAAKYTPDGGRITLEVERGDEAVVRIRDTGMGIASEMLPRVFDLFTQVERTLARAEGGLGLGLTLVRRLMEMHGGTVAATSAGQGQGSEFVVRLPVLPDETPSARTAKPAAAERRMAPAYGRRILVVDDNRDSAESLAMLLRLFGNDVRTVQDGRLALEVEAAYRPDVVLLDIGLPSLDGLEVCRRLRARTAKGQQLIVAMTGYGQEDDRRRSEEAGFDAHMVKPVDLDSLQELLSRPELTHHST